MRLFWPAFGVLLPVSLVQAQSLDRYQSTVAPFLAQHCLSCHSTKAKAAKLDLERFKDPQVAFIQRSRHAAQGESTVHCMPYEPPIEPQETCKPYWRFE